MIPREILMPLVAATLVAACDGRSAPEGSASPERPADAPALHHVGLNSVDPDAAVDWYLRLWPTASETVIAGRPAVAAEMYLVFEQVDEPPTGAFDPSLGRPRTQSPFWHIGAYANTTDMDRTLGAIGVEHLPLYTGPDDTRGVWRSGLTPYAGIVTADAVGSAERAEPRPGGFSYVLAPDGVLFELTGGPSTAPSLSHVHLFHEQPVCAADWYVSVLGMSLPPAAEGGAADEAPTDCRGDAAAPGWPSLERIGTIRGPRATVVHGNGSISFYPRQCVGARCAVDQPLVPSRGQALDHVGFAVRDLDAWHRWLLASGAAILEEPHAFGDGRAFMIEGPDGLAIELVETGDPAPRPGA